MDLTGERYGRLTVLESAEPTMYKCRGKLRPYPNWWCKCDCGKKVIVSQNHLRTGHTSSCGCYNSDKTRERNIKNTTLNKYDLSGSYGIGYTSKGEEFYFDLEDYNKIKDYHWYINSNGYVVSELRGSRTNRKRIQMHNIVLPTDDDYIVDHIYGKETRNDNRKYNLRPATYTENDINFDMQSNNTSGIKGVHWDKNENKWTARIWVNKECVFLGRYENIKDAEKARKEAEKKYHKDFVYKGNEYVLN